MAHFGKDQDNFGSSRTVRIVGTESVDNYTVYVIEVTLGSYSWTVRHRYSDFHDLHDKLYVSTYEIDKNLLPPKKLFGNQSEAFIRRRQSELEVYLQSVLFQLAHRLPPSLVFFLDFHKYEIHGLAQCLAEELYNKGDSILLARDAYQLTPLQMYAITERLKLPEPTCDSGDMKKDIGHILDFITRLKHLKVIGTRDPVGTSNINMNQLKFDLTLFKSLQTLQLLNCNVMALSGLETVKQTLTEMRSHHCLKSLRDILLQNLPHWRADDGSLLVSYWDQLTLVDFSHNNLEAIDDCMQLMPRVNHVDFSHNQITSIQHLQWLSHLTHLDLSHNAIHILDSLHTKLGNLKMLNLAGNNLESLHGFSKLFCLQHLDISNNEISQILEVKHISRLPCLEHLVLMGNPVTIVLDYRTKVLEFFGARSNEVCLDNQATTQKELDTVAVLQAIHKAKENRERVRSLSMKKAPNDVPIADSKDPDSEGPSSKGTHVDVDNDRTTVQSPTFSTDHLRRQMEALRAQGGESWLQILNCMQTPMPGAPVIPDSSITAEPTVTSPPTLLSLANHRNTKPSSSSDPTIQHVMHHSEIRVEPTSKPSSSSDPTIQHVMHHSEIRDEPTSKPSSSSDPTIQHVMHHSEIRVEPTSKPSSSSDPTIQHVMHHSEIRVEPTRKEVGNVKHKNPDATDGKTAISIKRTESPNNPTLDQGRLHNPHTREEILTEFTNFQSKAETVPQVMYYNFSDLPSTANKSYTSWLQQKLFRDFSLKPGMNLNIEPEKINCLLWCYYIQYTNPIQRVACCVIVADERIFIQKLKKTSDDFKGIPDLETYYILPLSNLQQLVIGYSYNHIRMEESLFQGNGTFVFCGAESLLIKRFVNTLIQRFTSCSNLGKAEVVNMIEDQQFLNIIKETELTYGFASAPFQFIQIVSCGSLFFYLVLMENHVYLLESKLMHLPKTTFDDEHLVCEPKIVQQHTLMSKINDIKMYSSSSVDANIGDPPADSQVAYDESGLSLVFYNLNGNYQSALNILFFNSVQRDEFLDKLTHMRYVKTHSQSLSPTEEVRREPEGGNEATINSHTVVSQQVVTLPKTTEAAPVLPDSVLEDERMKLCSVDFLNPELIEHLSLNMDSYCLLKSLSPRLKYFSSLKGSDVARYFHANISLIGAENEELRHALWTNVLLYTDPQREIITCVLLSTKAIYLLTDDEQLKKCSSKPLWKSHARHSSDTAIQQLNRPPSDHSIAGILNVGKTDQTVRAYKVLEYSQLQQINVGLFDQFVRLTGENEDEVFTLAIRDCFVTSLFIDQLTSALSEFVTLPLSDLTNSDSDQDFYKTFARRTASTTDGLEYIHPSKVRFCYPGEDSLTDILYLINDYLKLPPSIKDAFHIWIYVLGYVNFLPSDDGFDSDAFRPNSIMITNTHICIVEEDIVSYPLTDFARGLPELPKQKIIEMRKIDNLRHVQLMKANALSMVLVFSDEDEDIIVDDAMEHYSPKDGAMWRPAAPDFKVALWIQSEREKDKFLQLLKREWSDLRDDLALPVVVV